MSVQRIKDVAELGISVAELVDSVADGVSLADVFSVVGVLKKVKPAVDSVKSGKLLDDYAALTVDEKVELGKWFDEQFDIKEDKIELAVEQAWKVVLELSELVKLIKPGA